MAEKAPAVHDGESGKPDVDYPFIYGFLWYEEHPSQRYRIVKPCQVMSEMGLGSYYFDKGDVGPRVLGEMQQAARDGGFSGLEEARNYAVRHSNIYVFHQVAGTTYIDFMKGMREDNKNIPPLFIYECDDHMEYVDALNQAYQSNGCRAPSGELLNPGDEIVVQDDKAGKFTLYKDGRENFNIMHNRRRISMLYKLARQCDGMSSSSRYLCDFYKHEIGCNNVFWSPNSILLNEYPQIDVTYPDDQIRVMWQGGDSHYHDLHPIKKALCAVVNRHPNVRLILWGKLFKSIVEDVPGDQLEYHRWIHHDAYPDKLAAMAPDINLAPLIDNEFNRAKSAIKWYEASVLKNPPATLAAAAGPYNEIEHEKNGMLYKTPAEFEEYLERLIADAAMRKALGKAAKEWVTVNRDARQVIPQWVGWLRELLERRHSKIEIPA